MLLFYHAVAITHFTIQNGETALDQASFKGHHKVVELLLGAGANPDIQNKVKTVMYIFKYFMHPCIHVILFQHLLYFTITGTYLVPSTLPNCSACVHYENSYKFIVY